MTLEEKRQAALQWLGTRYVLHPAYDPQPHHASTLYMLYVHRVWCCQQLRRIEMACAEVLDYPHKHFEETPWFWAIVVGSFLAAISVPYFLS